MKEQLLAARRVLAQTAPLEEEAAQLQSYVDDHLERIHKNEAYAAPLQEKIKPNIGDKGVRVGTLFGVIATLILALHLIITFLEGDSTNQNDTAFHIIFIFLWGSPLLVSAFLWGAFFRGRKLRRQILKPVLDRLQDLKEGEGFRQRNKWLAEIRDLTDRRNQILAANQAQLAFLPDFCHTLKAVDFMLECYDRGSAETLKDAIHLWYLTAQQEELRGKLAAAKEMEEILDSLCAQDPSDLKDRYILDGSLGGYPIAKLQE